MSYRGTFKYKEYYFKIEKMADKDLLIKEKLDYTGIFDFAAMYSFAYGWFKYEEYTVIEEEYTEKVSGAIKEMVVKWKATKNLSDYFKIEYAIKFDLKGLTDVEVEIDKIKKKMQKGKVSIEIKGTLVKDPFSNWEGNPFNKFLREMYDKYIIPGRVEGMQIKVIGDCRTFKDEMKRFFDTPGRR